MKVLHVFKTSLENSFGGVEKAIDGICRATLVHKVENIVLSIDGDEVSSVPISTTNYRLVKAKRNLLFASTAFSFSAFGLFRRLSSEVDIIHYHFPHPFNDILHLIVSPDKPCLVTYHSDVVRQKLLNMLYAPIRTAFFKKVSKIVATSPNYVHGSYVLRKFRSKLSVIPLAVSDDIDALDESRVEYFRNLLPKPYFLFVGVFRYYKGLIDVVKAVHGQQLQLVLAGEGAKIRREIERYIGRHRLSNVTLLGEVSDADKAILYRECFGFVFPSRFRSEAFGISLLEAALAGKPMISTELGTGTSYINVDGQTGITVPPSNPLALKGAMKFLVNNRSIAYTYGKNARERALRLFSTERMARSYLDLYRSLIRSN